MRQHGEPVVTLDCVAADDPGRVALKIGTESVERDVLAGATATLKPRDFGLFQISVARRFGEVMVPSGLVAMLAEAGPEMRDVVAITCGSGKRAKPRRMDTFFARGTEPT